MASKTEIRALQSTLNRFGSKAGFAILAEDGILGTKTTSAAQKTARWVMTNVEGARTYNVLQEVSNSTLYVDKYVNTLNNYFTSIANYLGLKKPSDGGGVSSATGPYEVTPPSPELGMGGSLQAGFPLIAGAGILAYMLLGKKKGKSRGRRRGRRRR